MFYLGGRCPFGPATVITNLVTAVPYIGRDIVQWIWGGFSVDNPTLHRFFCVPLFVSFCFGFSGCSTLTFSS